MAGVKEEQLYSLPELTQRNAAAPETPTETDARVDEAVHRACEHLHAAVRDWRAWCKTPDMEFYHTASHLAGCLDQAAYVLDHAAPGLIVHVIGALVTACETAARELGEPVEAEEGE